MAGKSFKGNLEILNLSRGGVRVDLGTEPRPRWLELSRELDVRLFSPEGSTILEARGKVVRIDEALAQRTFAVEFNQLLDDVTLREALRRAGRPPPLPNA